MKEQNAERNFEKALAEKAEGLVIKPSQSVWENVQNQLARDKKRRVAA